jgi:hypothetical protein
MYLFLSCASKGSSLKSTEIKAKAPLYGTPTEKITINECLYELPSDEYNFAVKVENKLCCVKKNSVTDINHIVKVERTNLKLAVNYLSGCGRTDIKLVCDGVLKSDAHNREYYEVKLLFVNNAPGDEVHNRELSYDLSALNINERTHIKFYSFSQLIRCIDFPPLADFKSKAFTF